MCHTAFSVRLTSLIGISLSPLLLSVCLALDFIQDQEPVKKGPLGGPEHCDSCSQSYCWLLFVSIWSLWLLL